MVLEYINLTVSKNPVYSFKKQDKKLTKTGRMGF